MASNPGCSLPGKKNTYPQPWLGMEADAHALSLLGCLRLGIQHLSWEHRQISRRETCNIPYTEHDGNDQQKQSSFEKPLKPVGESMCYGAKMRHYPPATVCGTSISESHARWYWKHHSWSATHKTYRYTWMYGYCAVSRSKSWAQCPKSTRMHAKISQRSFKVHWSKST